MSKTFSMTPQHATQSRRFVFPGESDKTPIRRSASSLRLNENKLDEYSAKKKRDLPANFAEDLLDLEIEMEREDVNIDSVKRLIELYTLAMEYYELRKSDKHIIFLSKLQALLTKPNVVDAMTCSADSKQTFEEQLAGDKDRRMGNFNKLVRQGTKNFNQDAGTIMQSHEEIKSTVKGILAASIAAQRAALKRKLEERKKLHLKRIDANYVETVERPTTRKRVNSRDAEDGYNMHRRRSSAEVKNLVMSVFTNAEESKSTKQASRKFNIKKALEVALIEDDREDDDAESDSSSDCTPTPVHGNEPGAQENNLFEGSGSLNNVNDDAKVSTVSVILDGSEKDLEEKRAEKRTSQTGSIIEESLGKENNVQAEENITAIENTQVEHQNESSQSIQADNKEDKEQKEEQSQKEENAQEKEHQAKINKEEVSKEEAPKEESHKQEVLGEELSKNKALSMESTPKEAFNEELLQNKPPQPDAPKIEVSAISDQNAVEESKKQADVDAGTPISQNDSDSGKPTSRRTSNARPSLRNRRESVVLEETKKRLITTMDAEHAEQIEELRAKLESGREQKLNEIRNKYILQKESLDAEMTSALLKKKLLQKALKEEEDEIRTFEEEYEGMIMKDVQKLKQRQKQQKLFKLTQLSV